MRFGKIVAAAVTAVLFFAANSASAAGIAGSKHDFSASAWSGTQICNVCHTPHNANQAAGQLWNHALTAATFTLYASSTLNAAPGQPTGVSKLCLSCHDGTVALDSFGGATGTNFIANNSAKLGTDLSNDHPISFAYTAALATADGSLVTPASAALVVAGIPLYGTNVECGSCHDVHSPTNGAFLRVSNAGSALCLKCHTK
ncbi:MAG: cytochrome c3 family protein [Sterolibacterium sp.]|nr:cytochrome c3 family protein [Sterolibacterium sp.]